MSNKWSCWLMTVVLCLSSTVSARQGAGQTQTKPTSPDQVIKLNTELVEVRAVVSDRQGQVVNGLKQEDFELLENGKPQSISFFSVTNIAGRESQPAIATDKLATGNAEAAKTSRERLSEVPARSVVLFVDTLHLSISSLAPVKQAARSFIDEQLTEQDLAALVSSAGTIGIAEQFTRNRQTLRYAIERITPRPSASESRFTPFLAGQIERGDRAALNVGVEIVKLEMHMGGGMARASLETFAKSKAAQVLAETNFKRQSTLLALKAVVERMAGLPGQRLIVLFSDGFTLFDHSGSMNTDTLRAVISQAARSGVTIYSIDAKGLQPPISSNAPFQFAFNDAAFRSFEAAAEKDLEHGLTSLAKDTGGEVFFKTNDLRVPLRQILNSTRLSYVLSYYPAEDNDPKKFRQITVRVKNHPEYTVHTPKGYLPADLAKAKKDAATMTPQQRLVEAMFAPLSQNDIGVSAATDYLESEMDRAQVSLRVYICGDKLAYREQNQQHSMSLELMTMIYDTQGVRVDAKSEIVSGNLPSRSLDLAKESGYTYARRVSLKPGLYQVRVGVRELNTERMGTAVAWVEVPNLTQNSKLTLSGLMLLDAPTDGKVPPTTVANKAQDHTLPLSKMTEGIRFYPRSQSGTYFFRLYQGPKFSLESLMMQTEFLQNSKSIAQSDWQPVTARQIGSDKKGVMIGGQIQFDNLKPGIYELRLNVKDAQSKQMVQRTVAFGVE